ncbi:uncharacterized protein NESG_00221 [Nematocida ausubeli]|uniref:Uncharacterized protein n=2 Tax=Nematocida ausubeli (strain ATCC PRA-371 / ERTm2) TaxID=1913371 RepID=A0A086J4S8_NEMA1|nr:uncharacterized protein NESG_00221 [Nematocida ausubeli]KFG27146.1 hypothetical protein NESG_00221 [Nematocida ausubeli]
MEEKKEQDTIYGIPVKDYINSEVPILEEKTEEKTEKKTAIQESIEKIQKEQAAVEHKMQEIYGTVVKKFASLGIDVHRCTKLDIQGADMVQEVESLKEFHAVKESNARALLRLKTSKTSEKLLKVAEGIDEVCISLKSWAERVKASVDDIEKVIQARTTISELLAGEYIADRYRAFADRTEPLTEMLESAKAVVEANANIYTEKEKEEMLFSESFITMTTKEEKAFMHLILQLKN